MNILISVCEDFLFPVKVMLLSLTQHNSGLEIYLLRGSLTDEQVSGLNDFVREKCGAVMTAISAKGYFKDVPLSEMYSKPELYYRLLAPYILPPELDRILYMDADIIVNGSLSEFYGQDFDGAYAAVVSDRFYFCDEVQAQKKKLGMSDGDIYFNSGVILFNLKEFRNNISFEDITEFIAENREKLFYFDQDILNCLLKNHKKLCDSKNNFQMYPFEENLTLSHEDIINASVLHYTDRPKPWEVNYPGKLLYPYWSNAIKAGFIDEYLDFWKKRELL